MREWACYLIIKRHVYSTTKYENIPSFHSSHHFNSPLKLNSGSRQLLSDKRLFDKVFEWIRRVFKVGPAHPVFKKMKKPLNSEHLRMGTTTKILQSLGNYHDSILTTTMHWKLPHSVPSVKITLYRFLLKYASNIELNHQKWYWCFDWQLATPESQVQTSLLFAPLAVRVQAGCSIFPFYTPTQPLMQLYLKYKNKKYNTYFVRDPKYSWFEGIHVNFARDSKYSWIHEDSKNWIHFLITLCSHCYANCFLIFTD